MRDIIRLDGYHMDDENFQKPIRISNNKIYNLQL